MVSDSSVAQLAAAGLLLAGLVCAWTGRIVLGAHARLADVVAKNAVSWQPRGFLGRGRRSPLFALMWMTIYVSHFVLALVLAATSIAAPVSSAGLFNVCACAAAGLQLGAFWEPLFSEKRPWTFSAAALVLACVALVTLVGAAISRPLGGGTPLETFAATAVSFFAGWAAVAFVLSVGITTRVYNRGVDAGAAATGATSCAPLVLSLVLTAVAVSTGNPVVLAPLCLALFFVVPDFLIWCAALVCVCGIAGAVLVGLYGYN